jgi:hypothetical protein
MTNLSDQAQRLLLRDGFLGDGETHGGLWFLGFRGGGETHPDPNVQTDSKSSKWWQPSGNEDHTSRSTITLFESLFSAAVSKTKKNTVLYESENLWRAGSGTAHINLFPIEGPGTDDHSDEQIRKFGFDSNLQYQNKVRTVRFSEILNDIKSKVPAAVICFGKTSWTPVYRQCLGLEMDDPSTDKEKRFFIFEDRRILIMNHFAKGWITQYDRLFVVQKLAEWKVQIP